MPKIAAKGSWIPSSVCCYANSLESIKSQDIYMPLQKWMERSWYGDCENSTFLQVIEYLVEELPEVALMLQCV